MRAIVDLDKKTGNELTHVVGLTREKKAVVLRQAIRLGFTWSSCLPLLVPSGWRKKIEAVKLAMLEALAPKYLH